MRSNSFFCSWEPCEKLSRKTSAPAKKSFSIISLVELAGPKVTTCLVDLRQRCATLGTAATVASRGNEAVVYSPLAVVEVAM